MTWTAPRTWVTGEIVIASQMNTDVRDNTGELKNTVQGDGGDTLKHSHDSGNLSELSTYGGSLAATTIGQRFFASDLGAEFIADGTNWLGPINHVPELCEHYFDDFLGPSPLKQGSSDAGSGGQSGWRWTLGVTGTFDISDASRSQAALATGLSAGGSVYVRTSTFYAVAAGNVPAILQIRSVGFTVQASVYALGGFVSTYPGGVAKPDDGVFFFADGETDATWHAITRVNASDSADTDTGVSFVTGVHFMEIVITGTSEAKFYINHVLKATHSVAMPTDAMGCVLRIINQGAVNRTWTVDSTGVWAKRG